MANEIKVTTGVQVNSGALSLGSTNATNSYDQAAPIAPAPGGVNVGTAEETIDFGDVVPGWCEITNLDDANFVEFGFSTGVYGFYLPALSSCVLKLTNGITLYAKADTAACEVYIKGISD